MIMDFELQNWSYLNNVLWLVEKAQTTFYSNNQIQNKTSPDLDWRGLWEFFDYAEVTLD